MRAAVPPSAAARRAVGAPVTLIAPFPPRLTGQTAYAAHLRSVLAPHGLEVMALSGRDDRDGWRGYVAKARQALGVAWRLARGPRRNAIVVVLDGGIGLVLDLLFVLSARMRGARTIALSHHSFAYVARPSLPMRLLVRAAPGAVHLFLCERMRDRFVAHYGAVRHRILSNAAAVETAPAAASRERSFCIGYLSNITFEKGIRAYFELIDALLARGADVLGRIAGPAGSPDVEAFLRERLARSGGRVTWAGAVHGADKDRFLSGLAVLAFPTDYVNEAQPTVLFEALAHGVPTVTIDRGCIRGDMAGSGSLVASSAASFVAEAVPFVLDLVERHRAGDAAAVAATASARFEAARACSRQAEADLVALLLSVDSAGRDLGTVR